MRNNVFGNLFLNLSPDTKRIVMYSNVSYYDNKANMPAQINATITQNMSDRQPDIDSMILSMIFIFTLLKSKEMHNNTSLLSV